MHYCKNSRITVLVCPSNLTLVSALIKRLPLSADLNFSASIPGNISETRMINNKTPNVIFGLQKQRLSVND